MKTQLNIQILPEANCKFLSIADRSVYNTKLKIEDPAYIIIPPGSNQALYVEYKPNKIVTLDSTLFHNCDTLQCLEDGIYKIKQQVCPHDELWEEYYHLRTVKLDNELDKLRCSLMKNCAKDSDKLREEIQDAEFWLKQAKAAVENCGLLEKGDLFYIEAAKLIEKNNNDCGC